MSKSGPRGPSSFDPLRNRNFAILWSAALVSTVGSWLQTVAVGILITERTGQAGWTGLVAAAAFLPIGILSPVGGAMADRVDRKRWLLATTIGETLFAAMLAVLSATGHDNAAAVTLLVLGGGCMIALGYPAYQAILPDLVPRDQLLAASSLSLAQYNLGRVVGPALAGVILAFGSFTWAFAINAVSYGAVILALLAVRLPPRARSDEEGGLWQRIRVGVQALKAEPGCRLAVLSIAVIGLLLSPFIALIPAVALKVLDEGDTATSVLITAQGVGAVVGALLLAALARRFGRVRVLVLNLAVVPVLLVLYGLAPNLPAATVALVLVGMAYVGVLSGLGTVVQFRAPEAVRARVLSLYLVALGTIYPLGAVLQGFLGDRVGLRQVTIGTALAFLALMAVILLHRPRIADALADPEGAPEEEGVSGVNVVGPEAGV